MQNPTKLITGAATLADSFITSTPNGALNNVDESGRPSNPFHVKEFNVDELLGLLSPTFRDVTLYGQWLTPNGKLRALRAMQLFEQLNEAYYNPANRIGRAIKAILGLKSAPPPAYNGGADSFEGDYIIKPLSSDEYPWPPTTLIAVCQRKIRLND